MCVKTAKHVPPCPSCQRHASAFITRYGWTSYQCTNEACEQFPATNYHEDEARARAEWLLIAKPHSSPQP